MLEIKRSTKPGLSIVYYSHVVWAIIRLLFWQKMSQKYSIAIITLNRYIQTRKHVRYCSSIPDSISNNGRNPKRKRFKIFLLFWHPITYTTVFLDMISSRSNTRNVTCKLSARDVELDYIYIDLFWPNFIIAKCRAM